MPKMPPTLSKKKNLNLVCTAVILYILQFDIVTLQD